MSIIASHLRLLEASYKLALSTGAPGFIRVAFGLPAPDDFSKAADNLQRGLQQLMAEGFAATAAKYASQ